MTDIGISDLRKITSAIKDAYGYDFTNYAHSSFMRRINRILESRKISSIEGLVSLINNKVLTKEQFLDEITVNVTEMFRDPSFWRSMRSLLNEGFRKEKIWIWHAGCSSGEEVFSMLIVLHELGLLENANIAASDIDHIILNRAKSASIPLRNMELNCSNYKKYKEQEADLMKYFTVKNDQAVFNADFLSKVRFHNVDLVQAEPFGKFNIILCRNVLIYFNQNLQRQVLHLLHDSMFTNSYLALGTKENLYWSDIAYKYATVNNEEKIYKKIKD